MEQKNIGATLFSGSASPTQGNVDKGTPAAQAYGSYDDGTQVIIGVTWDSNKKIGFSFGWFFDDKDNAYTGYPIDFSDEEDFDIDSFIFSVNSETYLLNITEAIQ